MPRRRRLVEKRAYGIVGYQLNRVGFSTAALFDGWYTSRKFAEDVLPVWAADQRCAGMYLFIVEQTRTREQPFEDAVGPELYRGEVVCLNPMKEPAEVKD